MKQAEWTEFVNRIVDMSSDDLFALQGAIHEELIERLNEKTI